MDLPEILRLMAEEIKKSAKNTGLVVAWVESEGYPGKHLDSSFGRSVISAILTEAGNKNGLWMPLFLTDPKQTMATIRQFMDLGAYLATHDVEGLKQEGEKP